MDQKDTGLFSFLEISLCLHRVRVWLGWGQVCFLISRLEPDFCVWCPSISETCSALYMQNEFLDQTSDLAVLSRDIPDANSSFVLFLFWPFC